MDATLTTKSDIEDIQRRIPHRYPFLFIDLVKNIELNKSAVGVKNVTFNEPHFQGHFPKKTNNAWCHYC